MPNNGTLLNGVLTPKLRNSPFASWFLINLNFLLPHVAHFDNIIVLPCIFYVICIFLRPHAKDSILYLQFKLINFIAVNNFINAYFLPSSIKLNF